jgi:DNA polymerase II small subunit/DNA polymerase delta subunit B
MENEANETNSTEETVEVKTYTQEEVESLLQQETDRRVTAALKKAEKKKDAAVKEAERLAKMNDEERFQEELKQRENAIAEKERQLALAENKATAADVLSQRGISTKLTSLVLAEDAEDMMNNISLLEAEFKASVKAEVEKRLTTSTPKKNLPTDGTLTREQFRKMSLAEQSQLYQNNPDIYKSLTS